MTDPRPSRPTLLATMSGTMTDHMNLRSAERAAVTVEPPWWRKLGVAILKTLGVLGAVLALFIPKLGYSAWVGVATFAFCLFLVFGQRLIDFATAVPKVVGAMFGALGKGPAVPPTP